MQAKTIVERSEMYVKRKADIAMLESIDKEIVFSMIEVGKSIGVSLRKKFHRNLDLANYLLQVLVTLTFLRLFTGTLKILKAASMSSSPRR